MMINYETFMLSYTSPRSRFDAIQYRLTMMLLKVKFMKVPKHEKWLNLIRRFTKLFRESRHQQWQREGEMGHLQLNHFT